MKKILYASVMLGMVAVGTEGSAIAQTTKKADAKPAAKTGAKPAATSGPAGYVKYKGVAYKIVGHGKGTKKAAIGDIVEFHVIAQIDTVVTAGDRKGKHDTVVVGDSRHQQDGRPAVAKVDSVKTDGQWPAILPFLVTGDSVLVEVACGTILKNTPAEQKKQLPPWMKAGNKISINLKVEAIKTMEAYQKEMQAKQEQMQKDMKEKSAQQGPIDDKLIQDYLTQNNIKAEKTASGLYYSITKEGEGSAIGKGQTASVNYTGKLLNGKMFDSNTDPAKGHVQPFEFKVGAGRVIAGWDEGVALLKKGTKATLYIPSGMGYGARGAGADIPPNAVLMFDIEVLEVKP